MSSTTLDTKSLVPRAGLPKSINVVHLEHRQCKALQDVITSRLGTSKVVFGVCLRVSKRGAIEAIALATPTTAFLIAGGRKVSHHKKGSATFTIDLNHVLADPKCLLAGANIARLALLMNRDTGAHVSGLEALLLPAKTDHRDAQVTVADLVATHLSQSVQKRDIHALWLRNGNSDLCLRAWLLARYVPLLLRCSFSREGFLPHMSIQRWAPHLNTCGSRYICYRENVWGSCRM